VIQQSTDGKQRVLSLSYGKDSMACLGAIEQLGWTLDRIVTADVWATETIRADLPPMVEFTEYADKVILEKYGIKVEHFRADITYEQGIYHPIREETIRKRKEKRIASSKYLYNEYRAIWGFPIMRGAWCNSKLKMAALAKAKKGTEGAVSYVGIAADEPERIERHKIKPDVLMPLVEIGWTEADCRKWCEERGLLSPIYTTAARGGCWFCHNQGVGQLRLLRHNYPDLWALLLKWDVDSPTRYKADGHTVHDFDRRFQLEDEGLINPAEPFFWKMLDAELNYRMEGW